MNLGLFIKALREGRGTTIGYSIGLLCIGAVLALALPRFQRQIFEQMPQMPMLMQVRSAMLGADVSLAKGAEVVTAIAWAHPVFLFLAWAHAVACGTRVPAGEIDKGTIDVVLGLPVTRVGLLASETAAWLAQGAVLVGLGYAGSVIGARFGPRDLAAPAGPLAIVALNFFLMYVAVGCFAYLVSSMSDRRGRALSVVLMVLLGTFLVNYLGMIWEPAKRLVWLSVLNYHRPVYVMRDGVWPWRDFAVLGGMAAVMWGAAAVVFARRDISTT